jgi:Transposase DNA-binding/Transposase DDE domain
MDDAAKRAEAVVNEVESIELGDSRLDFRARRIASRLARKPDQGFPKALATEAELEGFYRFLGNDKVTPAAILKPHVEATVGRILEHGTVLAIHDTTEFRFAGEEREGLGKVTQWGHKLFAHFCLAVSSDGKRDPLGVLATKTWVRDGSPTPSSLRKSGVSYADVQDMPSEFSRWRESIEEAEKRVGDNASLIHVMDSESDDYELLHRSQSSGQRFVLRACSNRKLDAQATGALLGEKSRQFMRRSEVRVIREVELSRRKKSPVMGRTKRIEPRNERTATLLFSAATVTVCRPQLALKQLPATEALNLVSVVEKDPPNDMEPVDWLLITSEPIETEEQILAVVDIYRARWIIEEYFKSLKTGCAVEKRQLESKSTIDKALALFTPVAWALLRMRAASRSPIKAPIATILTPIQIIILRRETGIPLRKNSSAAEGYLAVARLGGHIKNNGAPGWQVIGRGYTELLTLEAGYKIAKREACDQS